MGTIEYQIRPAIREEQIVARNGMAQQAMGAIESYASTVYRGHDNKGKRCSTVRASIVDGLDVAECKLEFDKIITHFRERRFLERHICTAKVSKRQP